jgi:hypothetical protein
MNGAISKPPQKRTFDLEGFKTAFKEMFTVICPDDDARPAANFGQDEASGLNQPLSKQNEG